MKPARITHPAYAPFSERLTIAQQAQASLDALKFNHLVGSHKASDRQRRHYAATNRVETIRMERDAERKAAK